MIFSEREFVPVSNRHCERSEAIHLKRIKKNDIAKRLEYDTIANAKTMATCRL